MKKLISLIIVLVAIVLSMIIPTKNVYAANKKITALDVSKLNGKVVVSGTAESGTLAVAIAVYDEAGEKLITMETTAVNSSNEFVDSISLEEGSYLIKVADYDGGAFAEKTYTVEITEEEKAENTIAEEDTETEGSKNNPKTGDDIAVYTTLLIATTMGIIAIALEKARKKSK